MTKLLSVIVPVYNCEKFIKKCIDSILVQTYSDLEIILVNDGSSDHSGLICEEYSRKYENVISIHQNNSGVTAARLKGVLHSRGELITFVDADDWIEESYYSTLCEETEYDLIISGIYRYYNQKKCIEEKTYYEAGIYEKDEIIESIIRNMLWSPDISVWALDPSLCTKIFKRQYIIDELKKVQNVRSHYGDDAMVIFPMMFKIRNIKVVNKAFYYHRQREPGVVPYYIQGDQFIGRLHLVYQYLKDEFQRAGYIHIMGKQLDYFYFNAVELKKWSYEKARYIYSPIFPFIDMEKGADIILYGAGKVGEIYFAQNEKYNFCNIIAWADTNYKNLKNKKRRIISPESITQYSFDSVVIAVDDYNTALQIAGSLNKMGIPVEKMIWNKARRCIGELVC